MPDTAAPTRGRTIEVRDLEKIYRTDKGDTHALTPTSFSIEPGEFLSVVGPSGCGKSTLLMLVAGLVPASAGSVWIDGAKVTGPVTDVGIVFQQDLLMQWRRAIDNVLIQGEFRGLDKGRLRARAMELLEMAGLGEFVDVYPHELSGGMKQRVSLCRALVHDPPLLLMDEPFGSLDALTRDQMVMDLQGILRGTEATVLFITHDINEAIFLSDRVLVFGPAPGEVIDEVVVDLPRPRSVSVRETPEFAALQRRVRDRFSAMGVIRTYEETPAQAGGADQPGGDDR